VKVFDICEPSDMSASASIITFIKGDVTNFELLKSACHNVDCVYHLASFGMSGREQLNRKLIEKINVQGTKNVIKACQCERVGRLVYTSTYNVVFGGKEIVNGDESLPYLPLTEHVDHYSRTKAIAEIEVLHANCTSLDGETLLRTCALRLAGIYGPGEQRHLPRIVSYIRRGLFSFTYGSKNSLVDFVHVDNVIQAHFLAAHGLTEVKKYIAAGKAYFISDGLPVNNFKFFEPLVEGLGYTFPRINLPVLLIYYIAFIIEIIHGIIGPLYNFQPLLTRAEVYKTGVTHFFSTARAKHDLGYNPIVQNDLSSAVEWFIERGHRRTAKESCHDFFTPIFISILLSAMLFIIVFSVLPVAE